MESAFMVVGLNHRTAPLAVRERFYVEQNRRAGVLLNLVSAEGVEEVILLGTNSRTEFLIWANDPALAANSVLRYLSTQHGLKLCEWRQFYRLLDEEALLHIFRVVAGLDAINAGEPENEGHLKSAWEEAREAHTTGRFLDAVMEKALAVSERIQSEAPLGNAVDLSAAAKERAEAIAREEAQAFRPTLQPEHVIPTVIALRHRLDELCQQELAAFRDEHGPFSDPESEVMAELTSRVTQKIAAALARELKGLRERSEQEQMTAAIQRLFHLDAPGRALARAQH